MQEKSQIVDFEKQKQQNRHQTLEIRGFLEGLEELDILEELEKLDILDKLEKLDILDKLEARQYAIAKHRGKPSYIRVTRARMRTLQEFCFFAVTSVTQTI